MQNNQIDTLRKMIDATDTELLAILTQRMGISREIGAYKRAHGITPLDKERWQELLDARVAEGTAMGLSPKFVEKLYTLIHEASLAEQEHI